MIRWLVLSHRYISTVPSGTGPPSGHWSSGIWRRGPPQDGQMGSMVISSRGRLPGRRARGPSFPQNGAAHNPPAPPGAGGPDGRGRMGARTGPVCRVPAAPAGRTAAAPVVTP